MRVSISIWSRKTFLRVHRAQVVLDDLGRDRASRNVTRVLVVAEMNAAVDACVIDIVADLFELRARRGDRSLAMRPWPAKANPDTSTAAGDGQHGPSLNRFSKLRLLKLRSLQRS